MGLYDQHIEGFPHGTRKSRFNGDIDLKNACFHTKSDLEQLLALIENRPCTTRHTPFKLRLCKSTNIGLYVEHIERLSPGIYQPKLVYAKTRNSEFAAISFKILIVKTRRGPLMSF